MNMLLLLITYHDKRKTFLSFACRHSDELSRSRDRIGNEIATWQGGETILAVIQGLLSVLTSEILPLTEILINFI